MSSFVINSIICRKPKANGDINFEESFDRAKILVDDDKVLEWHEMVMETVLATSSCAIRHESWADELDAKSCVGRYGSANSSTAFVFSSL